MAKEEKESKNFVAGGIDFFRESYAELKKVYHPSRPETVALTIRVFGMVFMFGVFLGFADFFVGWMMKHVLT